MKNLIIKSGILTGIVSLLFSCEPQSLNIENPEQYSGVFMQSANTTISKTYDIEDQWHPISFGAGYGGFNELDRDLEVTFEVRPNLVDEYNSSNGTNYLAPPSDSYRIQQNKVTIPAGKSGSNSIALEVNPIHFQGTDPILIPVTIVSTSGDIKINEESKTTYFVVNGAYKTVYIQSSNEISSSTYDIENQWQSITVGARYEAFNALNRDLEVTFEVRADLVAAYNSSNGTNYSVPPTGSYRIQQNTVSIPAGGTETTTTLEVNPAYFQGGLPILIPVTIATVNGDIRIDEERKTTYFLVSGTPQYFPRTGWTATSPSQHDATTNAAQNTLDGNFASFYHSRYGTGAATLPHEITVDMKNIKTLHGVHIHGRRPSGSQASGSQTYLYPSVNVIEVSENGSTWVNVGQSMVTNPGAARRSGLGTTPVFMTELPSSTSTHTGARDDEPNHLLYFSQSVTARYLRITVYDNHAGSNQGVALSEIYTF